jgi:hypothetical protein
MIREIVVTILVPLCLISVVLLCMAVLTKLKQRRKRRTIESGVKEFLRQARSASEVPPETSMRLTRLNKSSHPIDGSRSSRF